MRRAGARLVLPALRLAVLLLAALPFAAGCSMGVRSRTASGPPPLTKEQLRLAPATQSVGGKVLTARAELWRSFMPISPPGGHPLAGVVDLSPGDGVGMPPVTEAYVWMVKDPDVWTTRLEREGPAPSGGGDRYRFSGGPLWGPGIAVDVIVGVRTAPDQVSLLSAGKVPIGRVE